MASFAFNRQRAEMVINPAACMRSPRIELLVVDCVENLLADDRCPHDDPRGACLSAWNSPDKVLGAFSGEATGIEIPEDRIGELGFQRTVVDRSAPDVNHRGDRSPASPPHTSVTDEFCTPHSASGFAYPV